jgi:hypothetical protein
MNKVKEFLTLREAEEFIKRMQKTLKKRESFFCERDLSGKFEVYLMD